MRKTVLVGICLLALASAAFAGSTDPAINYLIDQVQTSTLTFLRNGKRYDGKAAAQSMWRRASHFHDQIRTAEDFIHYTTNKNAIGGTPTEVELPDGRRMRMAQWLKRALRRYRSENAPAHR